MFLPSLLWGASNSILFMAIPLIPRFVCAFLMERLSTPRNHVNLRCILVFHGVSDGERTPLLFVSLFLALKSFLLPGPWHLPPYCVFQLSLTGPISSISCILITSGRSDLQAAHERKHTKPACLSWCSAAASLWILGKFICSLWGCAKWFCSWSAAAF